MIFAYAKILPSGMVRKTAHNFTIWIFDNTANGALGATLELMQRLFGHTEYLHNMQHMYSEQN
jgi:hypothetical protein